MPCQAEWLQKPNIVLVKFSGHISEDEFVAIIDQTIALAQEVPDDAVHMLIHVEEVKGFPPVDVLVREVRRFLRGAPNRDMSTMYGASAPVRFVLELLTRMAPLRVRVFDTHDEALDFIQQMVGRKRQAAGRDE